MATMRVETWRKIKATLLISMLAVAEARNMDILSNTFARKTSATEKQAKLFSEQAMKADPKLKEQADIIAREMKAMMAEPKFQEQAEQVAKELEAVLTESNFQEQSTRLTKQMEAMAANPHLQEQARRLVQQVGAMTAGPHMQEQAKAFVEQVESMKADPALNQQAKLFDEELEAMMANPKFQQMKAMSADPNSPGFKEHMSKLTADPAFQAQVKRIAEHAEKMMADPTMQEQAKAFAEKMKTMKAEPLSQQEQMKRMAEQMGTLKVDPELETQAKIVAKEMTGIVTNPAIEKQANRVLERVRLMMTDPSLKERAQIIARQVEAMSRHAKFQGHSQQMEASKTHMVDSLVHNLSGEMFDRALKVAGVRNTFAPAFTRSSWNSPRKTSVSVAAEKENVAVMAKEEQVKVMDQRKSITVMAEKEREGGAVQDALAGLTVAFSLLSKAIACSSIVGVSPLVGLWSAVVMGVSAPLLGSRPGVISGTAAVVTVPLSQLVAARGTDYIAPAILLASALEVAFGAFQLSKYTVLVTDAVLAGFLNALGIILFESQGKIFTKAPDQAAAVGIAAICVVIVQFLPKLTKSVPSSLVGLIVSTGVGIALNLKLEKLVDKAGPATFQGGLSSLPTVIDFGKLAGQLTNPDILAFVVPAAFTIAFISILETLLAGRVVDELLDEPICTFTEDGRIECFREGQEEEDLDVPTKSVLALGAGQFISACLGGFGGCGLIPQTVLNIKSGGGGALSSTAYAASMATFVLLLAPAVGQITSPALAGIFLTVAYDTVQWEATANTVKAALPGNSANPREARIELVALLTAGVVCYKVDAALGIVAGVAVEQSLRRIVPE